LRRCGVRVIAFDIIFEAPHNATEDNLFAESLHRAGNVILFEYLSREVISSLSSAGGTDPQIVVDRLIPPIPELAQAAAGIAPFSLPKVPAKVSQIQLFKQSAGDMPTLPVVALQHYLFAFWKDWLALLRDGISPEAVHHLQNLSPEGKSPDSAALTRQIGLLIRSKPKLVNTLDAKVKRLAEPRRSALTALLAMYSGTQSRYIDFYGPPHSITTIPYYKLLQESPELDAELAGKAVFIGFSEQLQPEQKDGFYTVFSQSDGLDISGVEIAATTFANLLEGRRVTPLEPRALLAVIGLWGMLVAVLFMTLPGIVLIPTAAMMTAIALGTANYLFSSNGIWLPLIVPLVFQLPFALISALFWRYTRSRKEGHQIREAFGHYLPDQVVTELIRDLGELPSKGRLVNGICLATDASQYTRLAENLAPDELQNLLNHYYTILFNPVKQHGGFISDVVGDAMLAIWAKSTLDQELRKNACFAALEIIAAVYQFNQQSTQPRLPTRIGLHCGEMLLGNVGADNHFEYRAVGDIVNTASRIEGLNKQLGTRLLASSQVLEGLNDLVTREVGTFRFVGKSNPLVIHELIARDSQCDMTIRARYAHFASALQNFRQQRWQEARVSFQQLISRYGMDGPSIFYLDLCARYLDKPPLSPWDGVVPLSHK
jgi:adenylate cyclase